MKVIIAGSRHCHDYELLKEVINESPFKITEVICGQARGVDALGERWAIENNIPIKYFPADWEEYGKGAGPIRNGQMARYGEALVLIIYQNSRGSANMLKQMKAARKPYHVKEVL